MISLLSIVAIGFFLGMRHATDADHVIAVSTIVSRQQSPWRAALIGGVWGIGHTLTIFAVGMAIILFNLVIPARLGLTMELSVGFMLIALGVWNVASFLHARPQTDARIHSHAHAHGDYVHTHPHGHAPGAHTHTPEQTPLAWLDRRLANLAARWAIAYLLVFGVGTIAGMTLITLSMMSAFAYVGARSKWFTQRLAIASGLISLAFGLFLTYQIFFVKGLLTNHPQWTPH